MTPRCKSCRRAAGFRHRPRGLCRLCSIIAPVERALSGDHLLYGPPRTITSIVSAGIGAQFYTVISHCGDLMKGQYVFIGPVMFLIMDISLDAETGGVTAILRSESHGRHHIPCGARVLPHPHY